MRIEPSIREDDAYMPAICRILSTLLCDSVVCQADLRERTGLSHPVVVQQVAQLRRSGLIQFGRPQGGLTGRPRIPITFNWDYRRLLAVEVHPTGLTTQATNLAGTAIAEATSRPIAAWTPTSVSQAIAAGIREALAAPGPAWAGIGLVVPGVISADRRTLMSWPSIPTWSQEALGDQLSREFGLPALLYNEAEALARYQWADGESGGASILAVSLRQQSRAIMAVISSSCAEYITDGPFGAIGHLPIEGSDRVCAICGGVCLDAVLRHGLSTEQRPRAMQALARILADMVTVFNPGSLLLQGDDAWCAADEAILRETLATRAFPGAGAGMPLICLPARADENLLGVANALAGQLLHLRDGMLLEWASNAN